ncbi:F-box domain-containing protein [Orpheovirus IHUMI-LCC2]|uniref:F-box domain-containing protein n=1 Tax=Orpheovirus IHUMI-LCC2 TaxID=2023057 RepID=A0A2I2L3M7_9VIRU|nr:F-box domain-containing protein [Orpheovirus IHUMI-LCC2]SNW62142.1 F-box domain-containing protein [Orpheovirus IHUMI-LCC2]
MIRDIIYNILSHVDDIHKHITNLRIVNKDWNYILRKDNDIFWRNKLQMEYGNMELGKCKNWMKRYMSCCRLGETMLINPYDQSYNRKLNIRAIQAVFEGYNIAYIDDNYDMFLTSGRERIYIDNEVSYIVPNNHVSYNGLFYVKERDLYMYKDAISVQITKSKDIKHAFRNSRHCTIILGYGGNYYYAMYNTTTDMWNLDGNYYYAMYNKTMDNPSIVDFGCIQRTESNKNNPVIKLCSKLTGTIIYDTVHFICLDDTENVTIWKAGNDGNLIQKYMVLGPFKAIYGGVYVIGIMAKMIN